MNITSLSRNKIKAGLNRAEPGTEPSQGRTRILFSPQKITEKNFDSACSVYSQVGADDFKTAVVVESSPGDAEKKLAMPSFKTITTHLGEVDANDLLRNDFADEDDDFFINDNAFNRDVSLYDQTIMLQCVLRDFTVSHIQVTDENSFIINELAAALEEILASRKALLICCCDLDEAEKKEIEEVIEMLESGNKSALMNYLNGGNSNIKGVGSFMTGLLVAKKWGLKIHFESDPKSGAIQSGMAVIQNQIILG